MIYVLGSLALVIKQRGKSHFVDEKIFRPAVVVASKIQKV